MLACLASFRQEIFGGRGLWPGPPLSMGESAKKLMARLKAGKKLIKIKKDSKSLKSLKNASMA
jgi:hypothetical protein